MYSVIFWGWQGLDLVISGGGQFRTLFIFWIPAHLGLASMMVHPAYLHSLYITYELQFLSAIYFLLRFVWLLLLTKLSHFRWQ